MKILNVYFAFTKIGKLITGEYDNKIMYIGFPGDKMIKKLTEFSKKNDFMVNLKKSELIKSTVKQIREYLDGNRREFSVPIKLTGTKLQVEIWNHVSQIPFGCTKSYSDIAKEIGNKNYARVIGNVMASNPVPIIIPCHRVIGKDGSLKGFGGGIKIKKYLIEHERETIR